MLLSTHLGIQGIERNMNLSELFSKSRASQIDWGGDLYSMYTLPTDATVVRLAFISSSAPLRQGIRLKSSGGSILVNDQSLQDVVLWEGSAPAVVEMRLQWEGSLNRSLRVWNCWERNGVTDAWTGNSGMRVEVREHGVFILQCSDGDGDPDFSDLVVEIQTR